MLQIDRTLKEKLELFLSYEGVGLRKEEVRYLMSLAWEAGVDWENAVQYDGKPEWDSIDDLYIYVGLDRVDSGYIREQ